MRIINIQPKFDDLQKPVVELNTLHPVIVKSFQDRKHVTRFKIKGAVELYYNHGQKNNSGISALRCEERI